MSRTYRKSLSDQVHEILRTWIVSMELAPGERFVERQIVEKTGFGAMPVREALDRLSQEGLVRTIPRHGYQVTPITRKYVHDFFQVWTPVAAMVTRIACMRATDAQIAEMVDEGGLSGRRADQLSGAQRSKIVEMSFQRMVDIADNEHLAGIWWRLSGVCARIFELATRHAPETATLDIKTFSAALVARDADSASAAAAAYVDRVRAVVLSQVGGDEPAAPVVPSPRGRVLTPT